MRAQRQGTEHFRSDIQGLRALAVTLVVVFHLAPAALPGGYIGVDVFFVISGFLITGHLLREIERTGRVRLGTFWARRARRLLPAAYLVLLASILLVWLVLPLTSRHQNFVEIAFAAGYIVNWRLSAMSVDYLGAENDASIAQHYWSLSVEEQFYLLWPLLLVLAVWIAARSGRLHRRGVIAALVGTIAIASFAYSIAATNASQPEAYFATTTRAWEFAAGGLVALAGTATAKRRVPVVGATALAAFSWACVVAILASALLFSATTAFPGWIAAIPVLACCGLLWAGGAGGEAPTPWAGWSPQRLAGWRGVQFTGDVSYSAYLWHWPLVIAAVAILGGPPSVPGMIALAAATLLLAGLTKRYVEDPVRRASGALGRTRPALVLTLASLVAMVGVSSAPIAADHAHARAYEAKVRDAAQDPSSCFGAGAILNDCAEPYRRSETVDPLATQVGYLLRVHDPEHCETRTVFGMDEVACSLDAAEGSTGVALIGDSHAEHFIAPMLLAAEREGWRLEIRTRGMCSALEAPEKTGGTARTDRCVEWGRRVIDEILADPGIGTVVFSLRSATRGDHSAHAAEVMRELQAAGKRIALIRDVPGTEHSTPPEGGALDGPECVAQSDAGDDPCAFDPPDWEDWSLRAATEVDAAVLDTHRVLCADGRCHVVIGGTIVYADSNHMAVPFAVTLAPWLADELRPIAAGPP